MRPSQQDALRFVEERWPWATEPLWRAAKLGEEAGEVLGAVIKRTEGRTDDGNVEQETAQVVLCAMALAESVGFDLWGAVVAEYRRATEGQG